MTGPSRRLLLGAGLTAGAGLLARRPAWAMSGSRGLTTLHGPEVKLVIDHAHIRIDGRARHAVAINGTVPGPLLRLREGQTVRLSVENRLREDSSIHWHGLLVPFQMDGVPGVSFPGIRPGQTFTYEFPLTHAGTYWYHSHSGLQEAEGCYAPLVIDPAGADPVQADREHVIVLSDHGDLHPHLIFRKLKQQGGIFNRQRQTIAGLMAGEDQTLAERLEWGAMRMDPTDISDVTGAVMSFLVNGHGPADNWTGLFRPGERVRLRIINAAAQMIFNVRIPGLRLTVVQADGQNVRPVTVDEFQIGNAETYDVIVQPAEDRAYALVAETVDRDGVALATLAPRTGMTAPPPAARRRPLATMKDMGMDHSAHMAAPAETPAPPPGMAEPRPRGSDLMGDMNGMEMSMRDGDFAPQVEMGPGVQMITAMPMDRTGEAGQGLEAVGHRVLVYRDLVALAANPDQRAPERAIDIRLTGNMERFMWGFDGRRFSDNPPPYSFRHGERVRINLINDTMMAHPIHMHGHFFELASGPVGQMPRKHTVIVAPAGQVSLDVTMEEGDWAFHCHMIYHMHAGMFQVLKVRRAPEPGA